jgi:hypothetical protein
MYHTSARMSSPLQALQERVQSEEKLRLKNYEIQGLRDSSPAAVARAGDHELCSCKMKFGTIIPNSCYM